MQEGYEKLHQNLPAHFLEVQIIDIHDSNCDFEIKSRTFGTNDCTIKYIWDFFQGTSPIIRTINLLETEGQDEAMENVVKEEEGEEIDNGLESGSTEVSSIDNAIQDKEKVRFQFDGKLIIDVQVSIGDLLDCSPDQLSSSASNSFHVVEYMSIIVMRVNLKYEIIEGSVYCDRVDAETHQIQIQSDLGMDANSGFDVFYASLTKEEQKYLSACSTFAPPGGSAQGACLEGVAHDDDGSNAGLTKAFTVGRPNISSPYTKSVIISILGATSAVQHTADFFVQGLFSLGKGRSFALPTHRPIMVLRDPPGKFLKCNNYDTSTYSH